MEDFDATLPPKRAREPESPDLEATVPPKRMRETERDIPQDFDPERTIPNRRMRREMGEFSVGDVIAYRYQVVSVLGRGAMGVVYRCFDKVASIEVALKGLPPELAGNDWEMKEIRRNFQLVHNLHHHNIASYNTLEFDLNSGGYFLVMEFVDGVELRTYMENNRPDHATIINIITAIASALDYAHAQQILHRDIKPGNIMIDRNGIVKILDFGLAAQIHSSMSKVSMVQDSSGTAPYMSPEQWRGRRQNASCDQYALGVVAYEMFAGFLPFESTDMGVLREVVLKETPEPLTNVTPSIQYAVNKALGKTPEERFPNCTAFAQALTAPVKRESKSKSGKIILLVVLLAILCAGGIGTYFALQSNPKVIYSSDNNSFIEDKARKEQERKEREEQERKEREEKRKEEARRKKEAEERAAVNGGLSGQTFTAQLPNGVKLEMVRIPNCARDGFMMGSPESEDGRYDNETLHKVYLTKDFYLGKYEVTQEQWKALMGTDVYQQKNKGDDYLMAGVGGQHPMYFVNYDDALDFCKKLTARGHNEGWLPDDWKFTLPTEAQWEYACRAGTTTPFSYGNSSDVYKMNFNGNYPYGGAGKGVYRGSTVEVGSLGYRNAFGLYDMHGNVWEWCLDSCNWKIGRGVVTNTYSGTQTDPLCTTGSSRVLRGGSWRYVAQYCRSANRVFFNDPTIRCNYAGFRLALVQTD